MTDAELLQAIEAALPDSFFADLELPRRVAKIVDEWRRQLIGAQPYAKVSRDELLGYLDVIRNAIDKSDSFEGNLLYTCMEEECGPDEFMVRIVFRHGNSMGQGGVSMIGVMPDDAS